MEAKEFELTVLSAQEKADADLEPLLLLGVLRERLQKMGAKVSVRKHPWEQGAVQLIANIDGLTVSVINDMQNGEGLHPFDCTATTFEMLIGDNDFPEGYLDIDTIIKKIKRELRKNKKIRG